MTRRRDPATLAALTADPANRRKHDQRNLDAIASSLKEVGAARSIVIDEDNVILAGNGVTQAARSAGLTKLRVIEASGDEIIAVRRRGLTDAQKRALALYDNRAAELASWDVEQLLADQAAGLELGAWWTDEELAALLTPDGGPKEGKTDPDAVPEVRATDIQRGDLFALGAHRLLCGDATDAADVARVMGEERWSAIVTDPPYSILGGGISVAGINTDIAFDRQFFRQWFRSALMVWSPSATGHAALWFTIDWRGAVAVEEALPGLPWRLAAVGVWERGGLGMGFALRKTYENFLLLVQESWARSKTDEVDVWAHQWTPANRKHGHQTEKPVELLQRAIELCGGARVFDPFLGSGTTLIAAEQLTRACRAIEIEPQYVQVALDRWQAFTGQRAEKVGEVTRSTVTHGPTNKARAAAQAAQAAPTRAPQPPARRRREKARPRQ